MKKDYYEILNVQKNASESDIKKSFRKLSKSYHPDKMVGKTEEEAKKAEEKFKEINEAYSILGNSEKRKLYDQFGHDMGREQNQGFGGGMTEQDFQDLVNNMQRESFFGFNPFGQNNKGHKPQTIVLNAQLTLNEVFNGVNKTFKYSVDRVCKHCNGKTYVESEGGKIENCKKCNGSGYLHTRNGHMMFTMTCQNCNGSGKIITNPCKACNGSGYERVNETIDVSFPKGIESDQGIPFRSKGNERIINGKSIIGDLMVVCKIKEHEIFERDGNDLHCIIEPSIYDAILGEEVTVTTIDRKERKFKLNIGTDTGDVFKLKGLGMPILNSNNFGNLFVHIKNKIPKQLTTEQTKLLKKLKLTTKTH